MKAVLFENDADVARSIAREHLHMYFTQKYNIAKFLRLGYTEADLGRWAETITSLGGSWRETFVYFKHEEAGTGPAFARRLIERLAV